MENHPPQALQQHICRRRQKQTELIGQKAVATGAVGKQIQLLLFDTVLHIATLTIKLLIKVSTYDVIDIIFVAPSEQTPAAKAAVTAKNYLNLRPDPAKTLHKQFQNRPAVDEN